MHPTEFDRLPRQKKLAVMNKMTPAERNKLRTDMRAIRLLAAIKKIDARIATKTPHPKTELYLEQRKEYMRSLDNLARYGEEQEPTGNEIAVNVAVEPS